MLISSHYLWSWIWDPGFLQGFWEEFYQGGTKYFWATFKKQRGEEEIGKDDDKGVQNRSEEGQNRAKGE